MEKIYMNFNSSSSTSIPPPLPPGFRFHPTDEELITRYLSPKVVDSSFRSTAVAEVDLNKVEPWDLPWKAKMGEKEWYFFCVRDRKYPNGSRANRATCCGYWKATGKDKEIFRGKKQLVGMKKTLVFYGGRAPKGEKSNWVMHEYRLQGQGNLNKFDKQQQHEWVICRVFKKSAGGKKLHISRLGTDKVEFPPGRRTTPKIEGSHVTCFSNPPLNKSFDDECIPNSDSVFSMQDQSMLRLLLESNGPAKTEEDIGGDINTTAASNHQVVLKPSDHELGFNIYDDDDQDFPIDCLWNY